MFNKLKQFNDLKSQAKALQDELGKESITVSSKGVELTMDGNLAITAVNIDEKALGDAKKLEEGIMEAHKDALKKMQRKMAMKMQQMGGLPNIPGLS
jgi:DNA-binding YbaB/EbfC family protein